MNNERNYGLVESDTRLSQVITVLDARKRVTLWKLDNYDESIINSESNKDRIMEINYVYELFDSKYGDLMENYVVDYIRFSFCDITIAIKPSKWS